jgi:hypothetical protein
MEQEKPKKPRTPSKKIEKTPELMKTFTDVIKRYARKSKNSTDSSDSESNDSESSESSCEESQTRQRMLENARIQAARGNLSQKELQDLEDSITKPDVPGSSKKQKENTPLKKREWDAASDMMYHTLFPKKPKKSE